MLILAFAISIENSIETFIQLNNFYEFNWMKEKNKMWDIDMNY